jgi:hypothetical protein
VLRGVVVMRGFLVRLTFAALLDHQKDAVMESAVVADGALAVAAAFADGERLGSASPPKFALRITTTSARFRSTARATSTIAPGQCRVFPVTLHRDPTHCIPRSFLRA